MITRPRTRPWAHQPAGRRPGRPGFTLVEVLVVLGILSLLAGLVTFSVVGLANRGAAEAFETDSYTLRSVVALFYYERHGCDPSPPSDAWNSSADNVTKGHYYPTASGLLPDKSIIAILEEANEAGRFYTFPDSAIWMGLLCNPPAETSTHDKDKACPLLGEGGPYLYEVPDSASRNNYSSSRGSYTWVLDGNGNLYGVHWDRSSWKVGCSGTYP